MALFVRDCERGGRQITVVVDPRPAAASITAVRVDLAEGTTTLGATERAFQPGEPAQPVTIEVPAPTRAAELTVELDTTSGPRRVRRTFVAEAGSNVTLVIDAIDPPATRE